MNVDNLIRQHKELLDLAGKLSETSKNTGSTEGAKNAVSAIAKLSGVLGIHLAMEDKHLYPKAIASDDQSLVALATRFQTEMGGIGDAFKQYKTQWMSADKITAASGDFVTSTAQLIGVLAARIEREESEFYPKISS